MSDPTHNTPKTALVVGASGGIGRALVDTLARDPTVGRVIALSRRPIGDDTPIVTWRRADVTEEASLAAALTGVPRLDLAVIATGVLHDEALQPEKTWRTLEATHLARLFAVNAIGPMLVAKQVIPRLPRADRAVFAALSARVGSISDNKLGGWYGYRASKAALNQLLRTLAIELARTHKEAICVGLHPGTVATGLSAPFRGNVAEGHLFTADETAARLLDVIARLTPRDSGNLFAFDGNIVPP